MAHELTVDQKKAVVLHAINDNPEISVAGIFAKTKESGLTRAVVRSLSKAFVSKGLVKTLVTSEGTGYKFVGTEIDLNGFPLPGAIEEAVEEQTPQKPEAKSTVKPASKASAVNTAPPSDKSGIPEKSPVTLKSVANLLVKANGKFRTKETLLLTLDGTKEEIDVVLADMVSQGYVDIDESLTESIAEEGVFKMNSKTADLLASVEEEPENKKEQKVSARVGAQKGKRADKDKVKEDVLLILSQSPSSDFTARRLKAIISEDYGYSVGMTSLTDVLDNLEENKEVKISETKGGRKKYLALRKRKVAPKPVVEAKPEPSIEPTPEPIAEVKPEIVVEPTTPEPVAEAVVEPVAEVIAEPVAEPTMDAATDLAALVAQLTSSLSGDPVEDSAILQESIKLLLENNAKLASEVKNWRALGKALASQ